jgi:ADP-ribosylglycohydrolase
MRVNLQQEPNFKKRMMGVIYGTAIGDALGFPVEFHPNPQGVVDLPTPALYSDDTQMFRATLEGLMAAGRDASLEEAAVHVARAYVAWSVSPENNRAPGAACMGGCAQLARGVPWRQAGRPDSGGCGAAMRSMAYGMCHQNTPSKAARWAAEHALMTHGHPMAQASAAAIAAGTAASLMGLTPNEIGRRMVKAAGPYDEETASMLAQAIRWAFDADISPAEVLDNWRGWAGHEAVAAALFCFLRAPSGFHDAVILAVNSPGDSDSLGCMTGALSGGYFGISGIPPGFVRDIEDSLGLQQMGEQFLRRMSEAKLTMR